MSLFLTPEELASLRPEQLEGITFITVKQDQWITAEQLERMRELMRQRDLLANPSRPVDADKLAEKLTALASKSKPSHVIMKKVKKLSDEEIQEKYNFPARSIPKVYDPEFASGKTQTELEDIIREEYQLDYQHEVCPISPPYRPESPETGPDFWEHEEEKTKAFVVAQYNLLVALGGRPVRPLQLDPGPWDPSGTRWKQFHVLDHWSQEADVVEPELQRWLDFRKHQRNIRNESEDFLKYQQDINDYRMQNGIQGTVKLHIQLEMQSKLEEWKEYQVFLHKKLVPRQRRNNRADEAYKAARAAGQDEEQSMGLLQDLNSTWVSMRPWKCAFEWAEQQLQIIAAEGPTSPKDEEHDRITQEDPQASRVRPDPSSAASYKSPPQSTRSSSTRKIRAASLPCTVKQPDPSSAASDETLPKSIRSSYTKERRATSLPCLVKQPASINSALRTGNPVDQYQDSTHPGSMPPQQRLVGQAAGLEQNPVLLPQATLSTSQGTLDNQQHTQATRSTQSDPGPRAPSKFPRFFERTTSGHNYKPAVTLGASQPAQDHATHPDAADSTSSRSIGPPPPSPSAEDAAAARPPHTPRQAKPSPEPNPTTTVPPTPPPSAAAEQQPPPPRTEPPFRRRSERIANRTAAAQHDQSPSPSPNPATATATPTAAASRPRRTAANNKAKPQPQPQPQTEGAPTSPRKRRAAASGEASGAKRRRRATRG